MEIVDSQFATKQDLKDLKKEIVDEISEVIADAMNNIGFHFQNMQKNLDELKTDVRSLHKTVNRIDKNLELTMDRTNDITIRVRKLEAA